MEKWDLQAVVGGGSSNVDAMENPKLSFGQWDFQQQDEDEDHLMSFPDIFETNSKVEDGLQELYKPFYPHFNPYSTQTIITSSLPIPTDVDESVEKPKRLQPFSGNKDPAKPKKLRKNQQNRVVQHVTADELPSDVWAWRKYGQKPIKGSPFPRSYYRCSSSKGCLARKQVERSCSDPQVFIITYTGSEHCHGHPTRRSSLAGSTRNKSLTAANKNEPLAAGTAVSSMGIKDENVEQGRVKLENLGMVELDGEEEWAKILSPDVMFSEDFDESVFLEQFQDLSPEIWCL